MPSAAERRANSSIGGLQGWANTEDRGARMAHVRKNSPTGLRFHAEPLGIDIDNCTDEERARVVTARKLWYARLAQQRKAHAKARKAAQEIVEAERLTAVANALETHDEAVGT